MRRLFSTRRFFLRGKNKISILNPCSSRSSLICSGLYRLAVLVLLLFLIMLLLQPDDNWLRTQRAPVAAPAAEPRIFCIVATFDYRQTSTAVHIKRTWIKHCDQHIFVSDDYHEELEPAVLPKLVEKWPRLRLQLEYVYNYHFRDGDWFLYAHDDNFVVVENLRYMLKSYNPEDLIYFGYKLRSPRNQIYMHDRAAMVFSRAALQKFTLEALPNHNICDPKTMGRPLEELGRCMSNLQVEAGDSRDYLGHHRFLPLEIDQVLKKPLNSSIQTHQLIITDTYYHIPDSKLPVSMRYISSQVEYMPEIYNLYYFTYLVKHFGTGPVSKWIENPHVIPDKEDNIF